MKKGKVYRPRRGMRFSNGRRGVSPPAGFVLGPSITRSRPAGPRSNLDGDGGFQNSSSAGAAAYQELTGLFQVGPTVRYFVTGAAGLNYEIRLITASIGFPAGTLIESINSSSFFYTSGVSLMGDYVNTLLASSSFLSVASGSDAPNDAMVAGSIGFVDPANPSGSFIGHSFLSGGYDGVDPLPSFDAMRIGSKGPFHGVDSVLMSGSVMRSLKIPDASYDPFSAVVSSSSLSLQGSVSMGRLYERKKLNASLISAPTNFAGGILPGIPPWPSPLVMDAGISPGVPSGTFVSHFGVGAYPSSSAQMASAVGWGTWGYGWFLDETTGSLTASFTPSTPLALQFDTSAGGNAVYGIAGPLGGADLAVGFTGSSRNTRFDGGQNFDVAVNADLLFAYVGRYRFITSSFGNMFGKVDASFSKGWSVTGQDGSSLMFKVWDGSTSKNARIGVHYLVGEWHVGIGGIDRTTGQQIYGIRSLDTGQVFTGTNNTIPAVPITASSPFFYGGSNWVGAQEGFDLAALYLSTGSGVSAGIFTNLPFALENLARQLGGASSIRTSPPSWTHAYLGKNQAFVIEALTSSNHESISFNTFESGTEQLESSSSPVSAPLHFSKESRFQTITVKKTASFFDTVVRSGSWVPKTFTAGTGALFSQVTGVIEESLVPGEGNSKDSSAWAPASILIPVDVSGKLVDLKVWVEWIAVSQSGDAGPLGALGMSLRSPNLTWGHAHPIRNDQNLNRIYTSPGETFSLLAGINEGYRRMYTGTGSAVDRFYRDSFLLWEGMAMYDLWSSNQPNHLGGLDGGQWSSHYPTWNKDRGMRTVFSDGASTPHPRHLNGSPSGNFVGSPNAGVGRTNAYGSDVPWTSDPSQGGAATFLAVGSPPKGWLTGPGETAGVNEWPTTGVNYGTNQIKPIYPFLEQVIQRKRITTEAQPTSGTNNPNGVPANFRPDLWVGTRPGLRGTEISGTWELMLLGGGSEANFAATNLYFRQVRLEFTVETPSYTRTNRFTRRRQPIKAGTTNLVSSISGSDAAVYLSSPAIAGWDYWISDTFAVIDGGGEIGRSFGLSKNSGNVPSDTALVYRLSGALASIVGSTPSWLFTGQGGMPTIPESSASLVPFTAESIQSLPFSGFLQPRRDLDFPQRLTDVAADSNPQVKLRDLAIAFVSSSAT